MMRNQSLALMLFASLVVLGTMANENPIQTGPGSKLKIIDNSRVLTPEEVEKLPNKNELPIVVPLLKSPLSPAIQPKIGIVVNNDEKIPKKVVDEKAADVVADLSKQDESSVKLPPIPLIMPSFLNSVFEQQQPSDDSSDSNTGDDKQKGFMNVLVLRSQRVEDSSNPEGGIKSSVVIMRYLPKSIGSFFGVGGAGEQTVDSEQNTQKLLGGGDNDVDKKRIHLFGGDDDVDKKRIHLFGGDDDVDMKRMHMNMMGGEGDPDHNGGRVELDENNKGVFTGGNEDVFANSDQHRIFVFSMFDRLRSMFDNMRQSFEQQIPSFSPSSSLSENNEPNNLEAAVPFISIRTDDGQSALIPNDIGYAEKQQHEQSLNKCMMLQFMRLKASMYYRTILHLLFFTGVLLFIFSLVMLMLRACRRRQLTRRLPHHHHHHHRSNMSIASIESGKSKLAAYKAWQGMDQSSLIDSDKIVLIQAPPAYDQVYIQDKNSTLTTGVVPRPSLVDACQTTDECETKSLPPPEYELAKQ